MLLAINKYPKIEDFFLKSDLWIFTTVMTMISLVLTLEIEPYSLALFIGALLIKGFLFSPVLWFVHSRLRLKKQMKKWPFRSLQGFIFVLFPFLAVTLAELFTVELITDWRYYSKDLMVDIAVTGMSFFATAIVLYGLLQSEWLPNIRKRIGRYLKPSVIFGVFYVLAASAIVLPSPLFESSTRDVSDLVAAGMFLSATAQLCLVHLPFLGLFQIHHKFLYRKLFLERGLLYYMTGGAAAMLMFTPLHGIYARLCPFDKEWSHVISGQEISIIAPENFVLTAGFLIFTIPVVLLLEWFHKTRTIALLEKEKTDTELSLLKQQVNPHFFFNTLNNLYSLSLKQDPATPETVLQLSELMRYVIYRAKEERVELQEEVKYLEDYLDLQRIRLYQEADIDFVIDVENPELEVPPLLFIILVENAFKHGIEPAVEDCFLQIELIERGGEITFICHNSREEREEDDHQKPGIGLENMTRRLELLYPDLHELSIRETAVDYRVELTLWEAMPLTAPAPEEDVYEVRYDLDEQLL